MVTVSVIVPMYNAAMFVERTLRSIIAQNVEGLEIIVVDDGSTDDSYRVVEEFFSMEFMGSIRTKLVSQKNSGVSTARNLGLSLARGDYVIFFDSDDIMDPDCVRTMFEKARLTRADVVLCGYDRVTEEGIMVQHYPYSYFDGVLPGTEVLLLIFKKEIAVWNGSVFYSRKFLEDNSLSYSDGCTHSEDTEFIWKALLLSDRIVCTPEALVKYVQRKGSAIRTPSIRRFHAVAAMRRFRLFLIKNGAPSLLLRFVEKKIIPNRYISVIALLYAYGYPKHEALKLLRHPFIQNEIHKYTPDTPEETVKAFLFKRFPSLYLQYQKKKATRFL